ncbi:hypothetical protein NDN08_006812 [Rhodosorus marinus]|uniref:Uncharacterized protein n=1 Tax=Rhodosorus marinus TaxID=101924 RepID=A0AAV8UMN1_9RHOD|nr:hypothetical protein NDN08_006812 [Rhodosorus marinus]
MERRTGRLMLLVVVIVASGLCIATPLAGGPYHKVQHARERKHVSENVKEAVPAKEEAAVGIKIGTQRKHLPSTEKPSMGEPGKEAQLKSKSTKPSKDTVLPVSIRKEQRSHERVKRASKSSENEEEAAHEAVGAENEENDVEQADQGETEETVQGDVEEVDQGELQEGAEEDEAEAVDEEEEADSEAAADADAGVGEEEEDVDGQDDQDDQDDRVASAAEEEPEEDNPDEEEEEEAAENENTDAEEAEVVDEEEQAEPAEEEDVEAVAEEEVDAAEEEPYTPDIEEEDDYDPIDDVEEDNEPGYLIKEDNDYAQDLTIETSAHKQRIPTLTQVGVQLESNELELQGRGFIGLPQLQCQYLDGDRRFLMTIAAKFYTNRLITCGLPSREAYPRSFESSSKLFVQVANTKGHFSNVIKFDLSPARRRSFVGNLIMFVLLCGVMVGVLLAVGLAYQRRQKRWYIEKSFKYANEFPAPTSDGVPMIKISNGLRHRANGLDSPVHDKDVENGMQREDLPPPETMEKTA